MSGRKEILTSPSNYYRPQQNRSRLSETNYASPAMLRKVSDDFSQRLRRQQNKQEKENREISRRLGTLGDQIKDQEVGFQKAIQRQNDKFQSRIQSMKNALSQDIQASDARTQKNMRELRKNFTDGLNNLNSALQSQIGSLRQDVNSEFTSLRKEINAAFVQTQNQIANIDSRVGNLEEKECQALQLAQEWLDYCVAQHSILESDVALERFLPGQIAPVQNRLLSAQQQLQAGHGQAALSSASMTAQNYNELRADLAIKKQEWEQALSAALLTTEVLLKDVQNQRRVKALDTENKLMDDVDVDVDFWTSGSLSVLENEIMKQLDLLSEDNCPLTTEELMRMYAETLPTQMDALSECVCQARSSMLLSQFRFDMASEICKAFEAQGFWIDGAESPLYENDERGPVIALLKAADGASLALRIVPDADSGSNKLEIHSYDAGNISENLLRVRRDDISNILRKELGMDSKPSRESADADPQVRKAFETARTKTQSM